MELRLLVVVSLLSASSAASSASSPFFALVLGRRLTACSGFIILPFASPIAQCPVENETTTTLPNNVNIQNGTDNDMQSQLLQDVLTYSVIRISIFLVVSHPDAANVSAMTMTLTLKLPRSPQHHDLMASSFQSLRATSSIDGGLVRSCKLARRTSPCPMAKSITPAQE
jgi:hypothetical protein